MKKIIFALLVGITLFGCNSNNCVECKNCDNTSNKTNITFRAFNDERYIWENWNFSTNKVNNL